MSFKCSLLGHSFDEADVEREREERGSQVVTIIREVERCGRCDKTRTVSENKEVTSIVEPDEGTETAASTALGGGADHAEGVQLEESSEPDEEDAEILRDDRSTERVPGQWPDDEEPWEPDGLVAGDEEASPSAPVATDAGTDEQATAREPVETEVEDDDHAEVLADDPADAAGSATRGSGIESPGAASVGGSGGEIIDAGEDDAATSSGGRPSTNGRTTSPEGGFVCPECGFRTSASATSLRAGDACPECQRGYLETERNS